MINLLAQFEPYEGINYFWFAACMVIIFIVTWMNTKPLESHLNINDEEEYQNTTNFTYENISSEPMTEEDWNIICRTAVEEAKAGSAAARTWVTKNIIENNANTTPQPPKPSKTKSKTKAQSYNGTPSDIVNDAVSVLRNAGHLKADAVKRVRECIKEKTYDTLQDLISDAFAK